MRNHWSPLHPLLLTITAIILHVSIRYNLVSILPLPILLSTALVWTTVSPGYYLIVLAIIGELFGSLPPGFMTLIVITPFFFFRLRRQIQVDISFSFVGLLTITIMLQLILLSLPHLWSSLFTISTWPRVLAIVPWQLIGLMLVINTLVAWLLTMASATFAPPEYQASALFDRQFYDRSSRH